MIKTLKQNIFHTQTLEERIAVISQLYEDSQRNGDLSYFEASAYEIFEIVKELQHKLRLVRIDKGDLKAKSDLLRKKFNEDSKCRLLWRKAAIKQLKTARKERDEALAKLEIATNGLTDLASTICTETRNPYAHHIVRMTKHAESVLKELNKQGEKHDE
jgi:hypothetical protein